MTISAKASADGSELIVTIDGRFDFSTHQDFRKAYEAVEPTPSGYVVDMQTTTYLDSSALGMLLLLRDYAGGDRANVRIINCNDDVKKILTISNFEQLFVIS